MSAPRSPGRRGGTRRFLLRRLAALLVCTALGVTALAAAYFGVSRNSRAVGDATAPAILQVAAARTALDASLEAAGEGIRSPSAGIEGPGEAYRVHISTAGQSLALAIKGTVAGDLGRQDLRTAVGLVSSYTGYIDVAYRERDDPTLRDAYLGYASTMLHRQDIGILDRLDAVQERQRQALIEQTSFGWLLWLVWAVAFLLLLALVWLLVDTQRFVRRHFQRRWNPCLAAATALVAVLLPLLAALTSGTQSMLKDARAPLVGAIGTDISGTSQDVADRLRGTGWRAGVVGWIPIGGVGLAALVLAGLQQRIDEYRWSQDASR